MDALTTIFLITSVIGSALVIWSHTKSGKKWLAKIGFAVYNMMANPVFKFSVDENSYSSLSISSKYFFLVFRISLIIFSS